MFLLNFLLGETLGGTLKPVTGKGLLSVLSVRSRFLRVEGSLEVLVRPVDDQPL